MTYAEALASKKVSVKSTVAVQALPTQGAPVQPVASAVSKMLRKRECPSVFPLENYSEEARKAEHIKQIKAGRKVADWPTKDVADFKHVLLVGHPVHEAHVIATKVLASHDCIHSMSAALLATEATRQDAPVSHVLSSLGQSRDSLLIAGCSMHSTVVTERMQWTTTEKGEHIYPKGHLLLVQWSRGSQDSEEVKDSEPAPLPRDNTAVRVVCSLNPQSLREGGNNTNKVETQKWAKEVCWETTAPLLKPPLTTPQAPYQTTRPRKFATPPAPQACVTALAPHTCARALDLCSTHQRAACITCNRLRKSGDACCALGHHRPGYVDRLPLSVTCR